MVDEPLALGVQVHQAADPLTLAKQLAVDLDGELCETVADAEALVADLGAFPALDEDQILVLRGLGARVAAARRIVDRTVDRAAAEVSERLAVIGSGLAIHPAAVRDRAAAVVRARDRVRQAEERLAAAEAEEEETAAAVSVPVATPAEPTRVVTTPAGRQRRRLFGARRARRRDEDDTSESTILLQQMAAATDEAFGARRAIEARHDVLALLRAQRDRAEEDVRVADRSWRDLAGDDAVEDVEDVVQRFDPQLQEARDLAQDAVGVRAVAPLLERALAAWTAGWGSLGMAPPETVDLAGIERAVERRGRPIVLVADAIERLDEVASAAPGIAVLVVEALPS